MLKLIRAWEKIDSQLQGHIGWIWLDHVGSHLNAQYAQCRCKPRPSDFFCHFPPNSPSSMYFTAPLGPRLWLRRFNCLSMPEDPEDFGRVEVAEVQRFADRDLSI